MSLDNFGPFPSDVWGTVSDWAAVIVYGVTGFFIWRTLQSQLKITKIEESRYKLSIMPLFDVNILPNSSFKIIKDDFIINLFLEIKLVNQNVARQFFMFLPNDNG